MAARIEPSRITLARRLKGFTKAMLAKELHVSIGAVTLWESGEREASAKLPDIAKVLDQPEGFFTGHEVSFTKPEVVSFRRRSDANRATRDCSAASIDLAASILTPAIRSEFQRLPEVVLPNLAGMTPEAAADSLRREWGLGQNPLRNVVEQLEAKGVRVFWIDSGSPSLSAFCKWVEGEPYLILNTAKRDGCRSRFDACHELGHLVLHRDLDFDLVDPRLVEREADSFASAFLMPQETFSEDAPRSFSRDGLLAIKPTWKVSVQAMVRRLFDLGIYSEWQYEYAFRSMSSWGWRRQAEPLAGAMETSRIHWRLCDKLEESNRAPRQFVEDLPLHWSVGAGMMPVLQVRQFQLNLRELFDEAPLGIDDQDMNSLPYDE